MIVAEFEIIANKLYGAFGMLTDEETQRVWWNQLKDLPLSDVEQAVDDYTRYNSRRPTVAEIFDGAKRVRLQRQVENDFHNVRLVRCPVCNDTGLVVKITPKGIAVGTPCTDCPRGKTNYPWYFLSDDEKAEWIKEEEKQGRKPPKHPSEASEEFYMMYCYGIENV